MRARPPSGHISLHFGSGTTPTRNPAMTANTHSTLDSNLTSMNSRHTSPMCEAANEAMKTMEHLNGAELTLRIDI
jgi:hypothetical protein